MPIAFARNVVNISQGAGSREASSSVAFSSNVRDAVVALNGFRLDFGGEDHRINVCEVIVERSAVSGRTVNFSVRCNFADEAANDSYRGSVAVIIIADVE